MPADATHSRRASARKLLSGMLSSQMFVQVDSFAQCCYIVRQTTPPPPPPPPTHPLPNQGLHTMRVGTTAKVLAKCMLKYYRISKCFMTGTRSRPCCMQECKVGQAFSGPDMSHAQNDERSSMRCLPERLLQQLVMVDHDAGSCM